MKRFTCDGPACARETGHPFRRWLELHEHTTDRNERRLWGARHFCGLICLAQWVMAQSEPFEQALAAPAPLAPVTGEGLLSLDNNRR